MLKTPVSLLLHRDGFPRSVFLLYDPLTLTDSSAFGVLVVVAADGKLGRYQAYFSAPGVDVSLDKYRQQGAEPEAEEVQLMVKMQELQFISDIQVKSDSHPELS